MHINNLTDRITVYIINYTRL